MGDYKLIWLVIGLPLFGALTQAIYGKAALAAFGVRKGRGVMGTIATGVIAVAFVLALIITFNLGSEAVSARSHIATLGSWIDIGTLRIPFEALVDPLSMTMALIITGVGALIHLYSTGYMSDEQDYTRFFTYLNLFISCMLILVLANNLVEMFIGWEGVGLCSYLLIAFWYKDVNNAKAGNKAFIVNRIGDWGLTLGIFLIFSVLVTHANQLTAAPDGRFLSYDVVLPAAITVFSHLPYLTTLIALLLFIGACGKSAQFPLYFWLPDAMAGPTPVSALIHAATMVTAGVFLVNRMHVFYELSPVASAVVACIGGFTALFAAVVAFGQTDIKKVLAYSTVSQLGFMFVACGSGAYWAGLFHVTTHAFFKGCLFLCSGAVIHAMAHNQDMRNYGNLSKYLKITCWTMVIASLALAGFPGSAGFFSKEAILGAALGNGQAVSGGVNLGYIAGWVALVAAFCTAWYISRLFMLTFFGKEERWRSIEPHPHHAHAEEHTHPAHEVHTHAPDKHGFFFSDEEMQARVEPMEEHGELDRNHTPHEVSPSMWVPLVILAFLSAVAGFILSNGEMFRNWLYPDGRLTFLSPTVVPGEPSKIPLTLYSAIASLGGLALGIYFYRNGLPSTEGWDLSKWNWFRRAAGSQFGYDNTVVSAGVDGGGEIAFSLWKYFDVSVVDGIVNGIAWATMQCGKFLRRFQTGYIRNYAMSMTFGGLLILVVVLYMFYGGGH